MGAGPAAAADETVYVYMPGQSGPSWAGRGAWDDSSDNLCALLGQNTMHDKVVARIFPENGTGPTFSVTDPNPLPAGYDVCTGNLSIPEDRLYRLRVTVTNLNGNTYSASSTFYT